MTTQEKLILILSKGCSIKIYPRGYPVSGIQGYMPEKTVYTSPKEGRVVTQVPFCIGYIAEFKDRTYPFHCIEFPEFIDILFGKLFDKKEVA